MMLCIADVLSVAECQQINDWLAATPFTDGRHTAGWHARSVKNNEQADGRHTFSQQANDILQQALHRNELFMAAALPRTLQPFLFARYGVGMHYGQHVDDAIMGNVRSDIALTVFLSAAEDYDGGELVIDSTAGEQAYKLPAGHALIYPANSLHEVAAVTRGERRVALSWVQSLVRDSERRNLLFDLDRTRRRLFEQQGKSPEFDNLARIYANLLRLWAQT